MVRASRRPPRTWISGVIPGRSKRSKVVKPTTGGWGPSAPDQDIPRYLGLYQRKQLQLDNLITHRFPLEKINEAIDAVRTGTAGRCLVKLAA